MNNVLNPNPDSGSQMPGIRVSHFLWLRDQLNDSGVRWCLAGGQGVNLWAERFLDEVPELRDFYPFTSLDIDPLLFSAEEVRRIPAFSLSSWNSSSPVVGVVGQHGELLRYLPGLVDAFWMDDLFELDGWKVPSPAALLATKCWNIFNIPQEGRMDTRHVRILDTLLPAFLKQASDHVVAKVQAILSLLAQTGTVNQMLAQHGQSRLANTSCLVQSVENPLPRFYACGELIELIRTCDDPSFTEGQDLYRLSKRESDWWCLLPLFWNGQEGERRIEEHVLRKYPIAIEKFVGHSLAKYGASSQTHRS